MPMLSQADKTAILNANVIDLQWIADRTGGIWTTGHIEGIVTKNLLFSFLTNEIHRFYKILNFNTQLVSNQYGHNLRSVGRLPFRIYGAWAGPSALPVCGGSGLANMFSAT